MPGPLKQMAQAGNIQTRATTAVGRTWTETYTMLRAGDPDVEHLLAQMEEHYNQGTVFTIDHLMTPGSGLPPNGTGTSGVTVSGAGQTGDTLSTTGWPTSTGDVVRAGDLISIAGVGAVRKIKADADSDPSGNASIKITPPIFTGRAPADGASITTTDVTLDAIVIQAPDLSGTDNAFYWGSLQIRFREVP